VPRSCGCALPPAGRMALWVGGLMRQVHAHLDGAGQRRRADGQLVQAPAPHAARRGWPRVHSCSSSSCTPRQSVQKKRWKEGQEDRRRRVALRRAATGSWLRTSTTPSRRSSKRVLQRHRRWSVSPWTIIEGTDDNGIATSVGRRSSGPGRPADPAGGARHVPTARDTVAEQFVDPDQQRDRARARRPVPVAAEEVAPTSAGCRRCRGSLHLLADEARRRGEISTVLAFEGWDAAGKGGAIRRHHLGPGGR
jgi:hypothetical protein